MDTENGRILDFDLYTYFYSLVKQIPDGCVSTYGDLALALGDPVSARAVGYMLSINRDPDGIPCYRVVLSDGSVGNYTHPLGPEEKKRRLESDGLKIINGKIAGFEKVRFRDFKTDKPLLAIKRMQEKMAEEIDLFDDYDYSTVSAVDVSYDDFNGYASMVSDGPEGRVIHNFVSPSRFPYIPGYLSCKEFKFVKKLSSGRSLIIMDGNGILHPRKMGLATFAGIELSTATIGVAKSMFYKADSDGYIRIDGERVGYAINKHTVVSPGHKISLDSSVSLVKSIGHGKYPEILKAAHYASVELRKMYTEKNSVSKV